MLVFAIQAGVQLGPGIRAARGEGVQGLWIAQVPRGSKDPWRGTLELPSGKVLRRDVSYDNGEVSSMHAGSIVPVLDTGGNGDSLYPRRGYNWKSNLWILVGTTAGFLIVQAWVLRTFLRRRSRNATWYQAEIR
jgi:hypothetical protein